MADHASVGFWVRRYLSEYLVHERGVSRNTQQSYRDTFCLFLPFVAAHRKTDVDKLVIDDLSPNIVLKFLSHLEQARSCSVATRNQRLATLHAFARYRETAAPSMRNGARRSAMFRSNERGGHPLRIWKKKNSTHCFRRRIGAVSSVNATTPCCCFSITRGLELVKQFELRSRI